MLNSLEIDSEFHFVNDLIILLGKINQIKQENGKSETLSESDQRKRLKTNLIEMISSNLSQIK